jgi:hypothetical protein
MGRLQIKADDEGLTLHSRRGNWKGGVRLFASGEDDLLIIDDDALAPSHLVIERDAAGQVTGLRCGMLAHMVRTEAVEPWA